MKKSIQLILLSALVVLTFSCRKQYDCTCTTTSYDSSGNSTVQTNTETSANPMTEKNAETWCNNKNVGPTAGSYGVTQTSCNLH